MSQVENNFSQDTFKYLSEDQDKGLYFINFIFFYFFLKCNQWSLYYIFIFPFCTLKATIPMTEIQWIIWLDTHVAWSSLLQEKMAINTSMLINLLCCWLV